MVLAMALMSTIPAACAQKGWPTIEVDTPKLDDALRKAPKREQPPALAASLASVSEGSLEQRIAALKKRVTHELAFVKGGEFMMGDFGSVWKPAGVDLTVEQDNKPLHKMRLTSYSLSRYRTTFAEYDVFTEAMGRPRYAIKSWGYTFRHPSLPVGVVWQGAKDYCQWLGKITGLPFDLPTEAQWEYAARNRGGFVMFATDNGHIELARNVPAARQGRRNYPASLMLDMINNPRNPMTSLVYPIGLFPPNPLGLYDMANNGFDWTGDWYAADYYGRSPEQDPTGPGGGRERVLRGVPNGVGYAIGQTVSRAKEVPDHDFPHLDGIRCAVNSPKAVKP
jgi:formylglycine-generating enzyme required for sulfatase activity